jgi:NNP family nitrate/nitrite transporter-like MFS transporter
VLQVQFASAFDTPMKVAGLTFLGPLLGSLIRPLGGCLADRFSGSAVTLWTFVGMTAGASLVLGASKAGSLPLFLVGFIALFVLSGLGNGSTYKMIPAIFTAKAAPAILAGSTVEAARRAAQRSTRALIGLAGAIGALGGVGVNLAFRQSFLANGRGDIAYVAFIGLYVVCATLTWAVYRRRAAGRLLEGV